MTYRELLELYKSGELELEQRKKVEKDIERQEAISDYLYEQEDIPELTGILEEKEQAQNDVDSEFIKLVNRSIRRAFRRLGITVFAAAVVLILLVQFCLPNFVSRFYYNPAKNIGNKDYSTNQMSRDMAVYSELFLPGKRRLSVQAESKGYGKYNITVNQTSSLTGTMTDVSGEIVRGKLRYYDNNILRKPVSNAFVYSNLVVKKGNTVDDNLKYTKKYFKMKDNEEVNMCAAGTKEQSQETLRNLDSQKMYIGYVSLDKIMTYEAFKKYIDKQDLSEVWCAVQVLDENIGFVCNPSYTSAISWDNKKYPNLLPGCNPDDMNNDDEWDTMEKNFLKESYASQHFVSLLNYLADQKKFLTMMEKNNNEYTPERLRETASYIKKNGLKIYGFATITDKDTLLKLSKQKEVYEIYSDIIH